MTLRNLPFDGFFDLRYTVHKGVVLWTGGSTVILFDKYPFFFWVYSGVAAVITVFHTYRGYRYYRLTKEADFVKWDPRDRNIVIYTQVALLYFISSFAGFVALLAALELSQKSITAGAGAVIVFLFSFGVVGVSGELPRLIWRGDILGIKKP